MAHTHYMGLSGTALRTAIGLTAGLCFVAFGYGQGDIGGLMVVPAFQHMFPEIDAVGIQTNHVARIAGLVVATWNLGCFVGAIVTMFVGDRIGRKGSIIAGLVLEGIGRIVQATSFSFGQYVAGRVLAGIGNGFLTSTVPAWQAECLKTHRRGTLLMVSFGACITAGLAIAYWIDYAFSWLSPSSASWRVPIAFGLVFILIALLLIVFLPESPRYLVLTGREQEAKFVLSALNEVSPEAEDTRREFLMVKNTLLHMTAGGLSEAFKNGRGRYAHRIILAIVLQIMSQFTGVNLFMQYLGSMFFNQLHFRISIALLLASCCATTFFLASLVSVVGIDRFWGRRSLTIFGASGMCGCMVILCVMAWLGTYQAHCVMAAFLFCYVAFFSVGWQGMSWLWAVELIPLSARGPANALASAANWLSNFAVVVATPDLFINITYRTYIVFAVTNFCIIPTIYFLYPETGLRSLEEVDILFSSANTTRFPWLSVVNTAKTACSTGPVPLDLKASHSSDPTAIASSDDEKSKHASSHPSDASTWAAYCRERESLEQRSGGGAATSPPRDGRNATMRSSSTQDSSGGAMPPPDARNGTMQTFSTQSSGGAMPPPDFRNGSMPQSHFRNETMQSTSTEALSVRPDSVAPPDIRYGPLMNSRNTRPRWTGLGPSIA